MREALARGPAGAQPKVSPGIAGSPFGKYTLVCKLATGGMGELFVARRAAAGGFEKLVVVKRLLPHLAEDAHFVAMLLDEARIAARLSHANVCQVYDLGEVDGHYYIAMEHLEGVPAALLLRRAGRTGEAIEIGLVAALVCQAAAGLDHAHGLCDRDGNPVGLVHRDVSPSNLFVTSTGAVKLLDFGVAKSQDALARTHTGALKGKYAYMSPEQVVGNPIDRRADVWSLGIVLYELMTGERLFWRDSEYKMLQAIVDEPIPSLRQRRPDAPVGVAEVAARALSREPSRRFARAREMGKALEDALISSGGVWPAPRIADYLAGHFGQLLHARRQEVQAGLAARARSRHPGPRGDLPGVVEEGTGDVTALADRASTDEIEVLAKARRERDVGSARRTRRAGRRAEPAGRPRAWLAALALATALGVVGMLAYRKWPLPARASTPIVVLGGEVETADGQVARAPARSPTDGRPPSPEATRPASLLEATRLASSPETTRPAAALGPAETSGGVKATANHPAVARARGVRDRPRAAAEAKRDPYSAVLGRHQPEFLRCFNRPAAAMAETPSVTLALDIDRGGRVRTAHLMPEKLEGTPLGECVLAIARRVQFARQTTPVRVAIPLHVRRR